MTGFLVRANICLIRIGDELGPELQLDVDESQIFLLSADPPSWVSFLDQANWWVKIFSGCAALYVAEIVKEAAKDTWRNRAKAVDVAKVAGGQLWRLAERLSSLRRRLSPQTAITVGLPVPSDFDSTRLLLDVGAPDDLVLQLALFVHHLPAVSEFIKSESLGRTTVATAITLTLLDDGALEMRWQENDTLNERRHILLLKRVG